jgi:diguanylate cyclase (GGDEF)-like protein
MSAHTDSATSRTGPALQGLEAALVSSLAQMGGMVLIKDATTGRYQYVSEAARNAWLMDAGAVDPLGALDVDLFDAAQAMVLRLADQQALASAFGTSVEHHIEHVGERRDFVVWRQALRRADGVATGLLCCWQDVTEQRQREQHMHALLAQLEQQQRAYAALRGEMQDSQVRDNVSGLYHRAHFEEQLRREADMSSREQREFAIVSVSVDGMENIQRTHGAEACERVVEALGRLLRANTRAMDSPCRLGGDRFVVLISGVGLATAHARMEQLRKQCAQHIVAFNGQQISFTVSMGVASFPHTAGSVDELMRSADRAMAQSRECGGNHLTLSSIQFVASA